MTPLSFVVLFLDQMNQIIPTRIATAATTPMIMKVLLDPSSPASSVASFSALSASSALTSASSAVSSAWSFFANAVFGGFSSFASFTSLFLMSTSLASTFSPRSAASLLASATSLASYFLSPFLTSDTMAAIPSASLSLMISSFFF